METRETRVVRETFGRCNFDLPESEEQIVFAGISPAASKAHVGLNPVLPPLLYIPTPHALRNDGCGGLGCAPRAGMAAGQGSKPLNPSFDPSPSATGQTTSHSVRNKRSCGTQRQPQFRLARYPCVDKDLHQVSSTSESSSSSVRDSTCCKNSVGSLTLCALT